MVIDIKMCRFDNVPWGFRLVGGSDFPCPLTVVKVNEGSIAEEAGLREGDIIVRINDTPTSPLSHEETNKTILSCGNVFYFGIYREDGEELESLTKFPIIGTERIKSPESFLDAGSSCMSPMSVTRFDDFPQHDSLSELNERPNSVLSENTERQLVEEEIAAVLSGESEVLKEHNTMGFVGQPMHEIFPKPGVCMSSDVLRTLNEEAIKTKAEKDKENKKWTTFLQKPNRPIPKSAAQIEAERRKANAYKPNIGKSAPTKTPERVVSPVVVPKPVEPEPEPVPVKEPTPPEVEEPPPADSEVPNLEVAETSSEEKSDEEKAVEEKEVSSLSSTSDDKESEESISPNAEVLEKPKMSSEAPRNEALESPEIEAAAEPQSPKTEEELALERQLANVQTQLAALSSLPSTIQATLDAVTKQLADLLPAFKLQPAVKVETPAREISLEKIEEILEDTENTHKAVDVDVDVADDDEQQIENKQQHGIMVEHDINDAEVESFDMTKKQEARQRKEETRQMENEQSERKQKQRHDHIMEELEEHLERKVAANGKRSKRAFGPLTPSSERPLVLPGGRRWYRPKDAYNDEFIAETLSAQAELITGTTLGVNFMKYQKPERKIDLNRSEVYKVIHHLDRQPVRGIEIRPPVVPAEADIRKAVHS